MKHTASPRLVFAGAQFDMSDIKSALALFALSVPPYGFAATILAITLGTLLLQQEIGAGFWKLVAGAAVTALCALIGLVWTLVYQKITSIERDSRERSEKMEVEFTRRQERIKQEMRELETILLTEIEATRQLQETQHYQNSEALCQIMVKLGIDPSPLFRVKNLK